MTRYGDTGGDMGPVDIRLRLSALWICPRERSHSARSDSDNALRIRASRGRIRVPARPPAPLPLCLAAVKPAARAWRAPGPR